MSVKENLSAVIKEIEKACIEAGRKPEEVKLVAVSKFHPYTAVEEAIEGGQLLFGENRVQEAKEKFGIISEKHPEALLHIIGSLQRNKVKDAVKIAGCIQSVDRIELLDEIEKQCAKIDKNIEVLFEVHTGEESKSGFENYTALYQALEKCAGGEYPHIIPKGFMTMAPLTDDESLISKSFSTLRQYAEDLKKEFKEFDLKELSMGMSSDFKIAIREGSTMVRIGTSIFGARQY